MKFLNTRLVVSRRKPLKKMLHLDLYQVNKRRLRMSRRSQAQLLGLLDTKEQKMGVSPNVWSRVSRNPRKYLPKLKARCISDVVGLEAAYKRLKSLVENITQ